MTTDHAALLILAHDAYTRYYAPWSHTDTPEQVIANVAAAMGVIGCRATFVVRKSIVRDMIEKGVYNARTEQE